MTLSFRDFVKIKWTERWVNQWVKKNNRQKKSDLGVLREGIASRVVFFYPGEEGTYVENVRVTLYQNGIVRIRGNFSEEATTHLQNCEILWNGETKNKEDSRSKLRLLKQAKSDAKLSTSEPSHQPDTP